MPIILIICFYSSCWLSTDGVIWSFIGPIALVILVSLGGFPQFVSYFRKSTLVKFIGYRNSNISFSLKFQNDMKDLFFIEISEYYLCFI